jgi:hypothetical protein
VTATSVERAFHDVPVEMDDEEMDDEEMDDEMDVFPEEHPSS